MPTLQQNEDFINNNCYQHALKWYEMLSGSNDIGPLMMEATTLFFGKRNSSGMLSEISKTTLDIINQQRS